MAVFQQYTSSGFVQQMQTDADFLQEVYAWLKRKRSEYQQASSQIATIFPDAADQTIATTFYQSMGRLVNVFENVAPTGTADLFANLSQIKGIA